MILEVALWCWFLTPVDLSKCALAICDEVVALVVRLISFGVVWVIWLLWSLALDQRDHALVLAALRLACRQPGQLLDVGLDVDLDPLKSAWVQWLAILIAGDLVVLIKLYEAEDPVVDRVQSVVLHKLALIVDLVQVADSVLALEIRPRRA